MQDGDYKDCASLAEAVSAPGRLQGCAEVALSILKVSTHPVTVSLDAEKGTGAAVTISIRAPGADLIATEDDFGGVAVWAATGSLVFGRRVDTQGARAEFRNAWRRIMAWWHCAPLEEMTDEKLPELAVLPRYDFGDGMLTAGNTALGEALASKAEAKARTDGEGEPK
jgi:hypothetical protein